MNIGATLNYLSADILAEQDTEFAEAGDAIPPVEDPELVVTHTLEESVVYFPHYLGGAEGFPVGGREQAPGFLEKALCPFCFKVHESKEAVVVNATHEVAFGVLKAMKVGKGQIDSDLIAEILPDIAKDVGELQAVTEADRVVARFLARAEEGKKDETDGGSYPVGVVLEVVPGSEALGSEV